MALDRIGKSKSACFGGGATPGGKRRFEGTNTERKIDGQKLLTRRPGGATAASTSSTLVPAGASSAPERV